MSVFSEVLQPLKARLPRLVREFEILRISAKIEGSDTAASAFAARQEVLRWVQKKAGKKLPQEAWDLHDYEMLHGGRNSAATRLSTPSVDIWSLRAEDPDKTIPGRVWTHEVAIGCKPGETPMISVRQLVSTSEDEPLIDPASPGFMFQIADSYQLVVDWQPLSSRPVLIASKDEADEFADQLVEPSRTLPVFVLTVPEGAEHSNQPLLDADELAKAVLGFGRVVVLPAEYTWVLTRRFDKQRAVFGGAVRAYLPEFSEDSDPFTHRLVVADRIRSADGAAQCLRWMRNLAATESIRRGKLGSNILPFSQVRNVALQVKQQVLEETGASESEQLAAMRGRLVALEDQIKRLESESSYFVGEHDKMEFRAQDAELQNRVLALRVQHLTDQIATRSSGTLGISPPASWHEFEDWCDKTLAGKLVLTSVARRGIRKPEFEDVGLAARCLTWLANEARDSLMGHSGLVLSESNIEQGVRNAHCGTDQFDLDWSGRRFTADWHVKSGGNTRDPNRCLRIYYFWDEDTKQVVIADMPAHRRTAAS